MEPHLPDPQHPEVVSVLRGVTGVGGVNLLPAEHETA